MLSLHPGVLDSYLITRGFLIGPLNSRYVTMTAYVRGFLLKLYGNFKGLLPATDIDPNFDRL